LKGRARLLKVILGKPLADPQFPSSPRKRGSSDWDEFQFRIPAFAGMTGLDMELDNGFLDLTVSGRRFG
jgi:hypothetical protein